MDLLFIPLIVKVFNLVIGKTVSCVIVEYQPGISCVSSLFFEYLNDLFTRETCLMPVRTKKMPISLIIRTVR